MNSLTLPRSIDHYYWHFAMHYILELAKPMSKERRGFLETRLNELFKCLLKKG